MNTHDMEVFALGVCQRLVPICEAHIEAGPTDGAHVRVTYPTAPGETPISETFAVSQIVDQYARAQVREMADRQMLAAFVLAGLVRIDAGVISTGPKGAPPPPNFDPPKGLPTPDRFDAPSGSHGVSIDPHD